MDVLSIVGRNNKIFDHDIMSLEETIKGAVRNSSFWSSEVWDNRAGYMQRDFGAWSEKITCRGY